MEVTMLKLREAAREWCRPVAALVLAAILVFVYSFRHAQVEREIHDVAVETHNALCTFTNDLQHRLDTTREFLQKHPGREPIPGISRADFRRSIQNQKATLDALAVLDC